MTDYLYGISPPVQALFGGIFTWAITAAGAMAMLFFASAEKKIMNVCLGIAAGVMAASSFWSLLEPSIELAGELFGNGWLIPSIGFMFGGAALAVSDRLFLKLTAPAGKSPKCALLIFSITLHNIPEGLAIGVAFASASGISGFIAACTLTLGIGLQNFPEGAAVSLPLLSRGKSRGRSLFMGTLSGAVEPVSAVLGALLAAASSLLMPFLLSFAAGAMIYVVISELIPESQSESRTSFVTIATLAGFAVMMMLDVAFK